MKQCVALLSIFLILSLLIVFTIPKVKANPDSATFTLAANTDDADQRDDATWSTTDGVGWIVAEASGSRRHSGFRFANVAIPQGSTVTSANLSIYAYRTDYDDMNCTIYGHDVDNSLTFNSTAGFKILDRTKTSASTAWTQGSTGTGWITSPDISSIVHAIVNNATWVSGNGLTLLLIANIAAAYWADHRTRDAGYASLLKVTWTESILPINYNIDLTLSPAVSFIEMVVGNYHATLSFQPSYTFTPSAKQGSFVNLLYQPAYSFTLKQWGNQWPYVPGPTETNPLIYAAICLAVIAVGIAAGGIQEKRKKG